jgi:next-to-BRCA1 protein 1
MSAETLSPQPVAQVSPVIARSPIPYMAPTVENVPEVAAPISPISPPAASADAEVKGEAPVPRSFTARQSKIGLQNMRRFLFTDNFHRLL